MFIVWSNSNSEKWRCQKTSMKKIWLCKCLIRRSVLWSHQNILDWSNRKYRNHQESSNHVISPTNFPGWYGNSMRYFHEVNWSSMQNMLFWRKNRCMTLSNTKKSALVLRWGTAYCSWCLYCWKAGGGSMSETDHFSQSLTAPHVPANIVRRQGPSLANPYQKRNPLDVNRFIIQHLQRGAKWFRKGIKFSIL